MLGREEEEKVVVVLDVEELEVKEEVVVLDVEEGQMMVSVSG